MNVFRGRPGLIAGAISVLCITVAAFCIPALTVTIIITALLSAVFCLALLILRVIRPYRCFSLLFIIIVLLVSLIRGYTYFENTFSKVESVCGEELHVHGTVTERRYSADFYTVYTVKLHSVEGKEADILASLECAYNSELQVGYEFVLRNARITSVWDYGTSAKSNYAAENIQLIIENESFEDCAILSEGNLTLRSKIARINSYLSAVLQNGIGGEEGRLAAAMLLGNRQLLDARVNRDFSRAGLSHYLAVSGMHVSILTAICGIVLAKLRIRREYKNVWMALFSVSYLILLGFPLSATRSVIMLLIVFAAYFAGDDSDALNSLGISAAVLMIAAPYALFDISFILSFCATAGIVIFIPAGEKLISLLSEKNARATEEKPAIKRNRFIQAFVKLIKEVLLGLYRSIFGVLSALSLTLLPTTLNFGMVSVVGIISNIPSMLVASPLLAFSALYLLFGRIPYLGEGLKLGVVFFAKALISFAGFFSRLEGSVVSLSSNFAKGVAITLTLLIILIIALKFRKKAFCAFTPVLYPIAILLIIFIVPTTYSSTVDATVISTGKDENFLITYQDKAAIIDVSDGSYSRLKRITELLDQSSATEIEALFLTHYHNQHVYSLKRLMSEEVLKNLYLPMPDNDADASVMYALVNAANEYNCNAYILESGSNVFVAGDVVAEFSSVERFNRSSHPAFWFTIGTENEKILYVSESAWELDSFTDALSKHISESDALLLSAHGPVSKSAFQVKCDNLKGIIVFDEALLSCVAVDDINAFYEKGGELIVGTQIRSFIFAD